MRKLVTLLLVCLAMPLCMSAQTAQDFASRFMEDNLDDKNLECVTIGPKMLREIMKLAKEYDKQDVMSFLSKIKSVRIINGDSLAGEYRKKALALLENSGKRYARYEKDGSDEDYGDCVWVRKRDDKIVELVYVGLAKEKDFMVLDVTGELDGGFVDSIVDNNRRN